MSEREPRFDWSVLHHPKTEEDAASPDGAEWGEAPQADSRDGTGYGLAGGAEDASIPLRVNDLKQYTYCPRIVFYQYSMPVQKKATFKMEHGKGVEAKVEQLERRRRLREYGLERGTRRFQVWLTSPTLALSGRLDLLIETPEAMYPVDFKDSLEPVRYNHHVQLCAYALLVEHSLGGVVPVGFIYRVPRNHVVPVAMTHELRADTLRCIDEIRAMIRNEQMPPPTTVRGRCVDCEYRNYCGDVF